MLGRSGEQFARKTGAFRGKRHWPGGESPVIRVGERGKRIVWCSPNWGQLVDGLMSLEGLETVMVGDLIRPRGAQDSNAGLAASYSRVNRAFANRQELAAALSAVHSIACLLTAAVIQETAVDGSGRPIACSNTY